MSPAACEPLMEDADVVVRGHARESYGLSRVESLLAGTPVVGTPVGEQLFVATYEYGDPDSLRAALGRPCATSSVMEEARAYFEAAGGRES